MTTDNDQFESYYIATVARMKLQVDNSEVLEEDRTRKYFEVLYQYAPTLAATPIVAASWLKNALQTQYIGPSDVKALADSENACRRSRINATVENHSKLWRRLMFPIPMDGIRPDLDTLRLEARAAVLKWLDMSIGIPTDPDGRDADSAGDA